VAEIGGGAVHDRREEARAAFAARFGRQVDPDGALPPAERARRADAARRAYFAELQLRFPLPPSSVIPAVGRRVQPMARAALTSAAAARPAPFCSVFEVGVEL
jgi:hypothetical protein